MDLLQYSSKITRISVNFDKTNTFLPSKCSFSKCVQYFNWIIERWPVEYVIYTASIPSAFTGVDITIFASAFAYISDVSSVKNRTLRVTILDICYLVTFPTGIALGK